MRHRSLILGVAIAALAAACRTTPVIPQTVTVVVEKTVGVPAELSRDCASRFPPVDPTYEDAVRLNNQRKADNDECTGRMRQIRALAP